MVAGFLLSVHSISFVPTFLALVLGEIVNGFLWYGVGYWGGARSLDWITRHSRNQQKIVAKMREYMERYTARAILFAKVTFSITVVTQILVGSVKYPIKRFSLYNIIGSLGWVALVLAIGFFFGTSYTILFGYLESVGHLVLFTAIVVAVIFVFQRVFRGAFARYFGIVERFQEFGEKIRDGLNRFVAPKDGEDL
jgi:membrane-associated protein